MANTRYTDTLRDTYYYFATLFYFTYFVLFYKELHCFDFSIGDVVADTTPVTTSKE